MELISDGPTDHNLGCWNLAVDMDIRCEHVRMSISCLNVGVDWSQGCPQRTWVVLHTLVCWSVCCASLSSLCFFSISLLSSLPIPSLPPVSSPWPSTLVILRCLTWVVLVYLDLLLPCSCVTLSWEKASSVTPQLCVSWWLFGLIHCHDSLCQLFGRPTGTNFAK